MKSEEILLIGGLGLAAFALFKPINEAGTGVATAVQGLGSGITTAASGLGIGISTAGEGLGGGISDIGGGVGEAITGLGSGIGSIGTGVQSYIEDVTAVTGAISDKAVSLIQGKTAAYKATSSPTNIPSIVETPTETSKLGLSAMAGYKTGSVGIAPYDPAVAQAIANGQPVNTGYATDKVYYLAGGLLGSKVTFDSREEADAYIAAHPEFQEKINKGTWVEVDAAVVEQRDAAITEDIRKVKADNYYKTGQLDKLSQL